MSCQHSFLRRIHPKRAHYISIRQLHCLSLLHSDDSKHERLLAWARCLPVEPPPDSTASLGVALFWTRKGNCTPWMWPNGGLSPPNWHQARPHGEAQPVTCAPKGRRPPRAPRETFHKTCYTEEPRRNLSLPKVIRQLLSLHSRPACLSDLRSSKTNPLSGTAKGSRTLKSPQHKGTLQKGGGGRELLLQRLWGHQLPELFPNCTTTQNVTVYLHWKPDEAVIAKKQKGKFNQSAILYDPQNAHCSNKSRLQAETFVGSAITFHLSATR